MRNGNVTSRVCPKCGRVDALLHECDVIEQLNEAWRQLDKARRQLAEAGLADV